MGELPPGSEELVLAFLAEAADDFVSGEAISGKLGPMCLSTESANVAFPENSASSS